MLSNMWDMYSCVLLHPHMFSGDVMFLEAPRKEQEA